MKAFFIAILAALLMSCGSSPVVSTTHLGKVKDVRYHLGGIFNCDMTEVHTESQVVLLYYTIQVPLGVDAVTYVNKRGAKYFAWQGTTEGYLCK